MRLFISLILFLLISSPSWATTWYIRDGGANKGSTSTTCNGQYNVVYTAGNGPNCAFNHPRWVFGWDADNPQSGVIAGGDTVYINGDSDTSPGNQAQYMIGYDDSGNNTTPSCSTSYPYDCYFPNVPAGSAGTHTKIIGTGAHKPQLWGNQRVPFIFQIVNNYIDLQWLEITDHQACAYNDAAQGCNYSGGYPYGAWAEDGLELGGTNLTLTDVYVHGVGRYGINVPDDISTEGNVTLTRVYSIGNGYGGVTTGINNSLTGTWTWNQPIVEWNGCVEAYPLTGGIDNSSNYTNCFGQNSSGYGDGIAFGNNGSGTLGIWYIYGPGSISWNTQDGLDTLHGSATSGTEDVDKMRFEGNAGNQVKLNGLNQSFTNNIVVANCGWWYGAAQSLSGGMTNGDSCRALGDALFFNVTNNSTTNIYNNTIFSNGSIVMESKDTNSTGCNQSGSTGTQIHIKNNIIQGGYAWWDDTSFNGTGGNSQTSYIYNDGNDGNGAGTCGGLTWDEDYNIVTGTKNSNQGCVGAHDKCGTSPGFVNSMLMGTSGGGQNTYYQGKAGITYAPITSGGASNRAGVNGLTYWNTSSDYYSTSRPNPPAMGGLEYNSSAGAGYLCFYNSDCSSGTCTNNSCASSGGGSTGVGNVYGGSLNITGIILK